MSEDYILVGVEVVVKATAPFITLWVMQRLFKFNSSLRANFVYYMIATALAVYLQIVSIPTIGFLEIIKADLLLAYTVSFLIFLLVLVVRKVFGKLCT